jgi:hypothetical protein
MRNTDPSTYADVFTWPLGTSPIYEIRAVGTRDFKSLGSHFWCGNVRLDVEDGDFTAIGEKV